MKILIGALAAAFTTATASAAPSLDTRSDDARVIVKYKADSTLRQPLASGLRPQPRHAAALGQRLGLPLTDRWVLGSHTQSLQARGISAEKLVARLRAQPDVEWAAVVGRKTIKAATPNDPYYADNQGAITPVAGQWYLRAPGGSIVSATNAIGGWALTTGSPAVTVAVLDTGVRFDHPDFKRADGSSKLYAGYDFVSRTSISADGNGRDTDATDPGDGSSASSPSSWHGTQTASIVGAASDNGIGMAGLGREVMVMPLRVLGKGGGYDDDIQAAMLWAAGISTDTSLPANLHPARVLNMSLGSHDPCNGAYPDVFSRLVNAGVTVVVAAGNGVEDTPGTPGGGIAVSSPANCPGALAVAGVRHTGTKVGYSDLGPEVAIAAPAGNCVNLSGACVYPILTATNSGTTTAGTNTWSNSFNYSVGTSFAAPQVAGAVALMLSMDPTLSSSAVRSALTSTARAFPTAAATGVAACAAPNAATPQDECACTSSTCGAGMLDVGAAVAAVVPASVALPTVMVEASTVSPAAGSTVTLSSPGTGAYGGRTIVGYQWSITAGSGFGAFSGATNAASATLATSASGVMTVQLTVTDSAGATASRTASINVQTAGSGGGSGSGTGSSDSGGGGALGFGWLAGLALAAAALSGRGRKTPRSPAA